MASTGGFEYASCNPFRGGILHFSLLVLIPGVLLSHNLVADDECILAFDINTTKTGLINYEAAVGSLNWYLCTTLRVDILLSYWQSDDVRVIV